MILDNLFLRNCVETNHAHRRMAFGVLCFALLDNRCVHFIYKWTGCSRYGWTVTNVNIQLWNCSNNVNDSSTWRFRTMSQLNQFCVNKLRYKHLSFSFTIISVWLFRGLDTWNWGFLFTLALLPIRIPFDTRLGFVEQLIDDAAITWLLLTQTS